MGRDRAMVFWSKKEGRRVSLRRRLKRTQLDGCGLKKKNGKKGES